MTCVVALYIVGMLEGPLGGVGNVIISETAGNVSVETGNVTVNHRGPLTVKLDAKDKAFLKHLSEDLVKVTVGDALKKMEESGQAKLTGKGWEVESDEPFRDAVQKAVHNSIQSELGLLKLAERADRTDPRVDALMNEVKGLREAYQVGEARRRLEEESWRTEPGWGLMLSPTAGFGQGTVSASAGGSAQVVWASGALSALSTWSRAVRPIFGIAAGYASMWREKQWIGAGQTLGTVREDLFGVGAVGGLLLQWQHWSLSGETELRTRPFAGLGLRWSVGAYGAMHLGKSDWWVRLGANAAPVDTGATVEDSAYDPLGPSTLYTSHVASPRLEATLGVMALLY